MKLLASLLCIGLSLACEITEAAWFGPSNHEDCVLEKMKGQPPAMLPTARAACARQFPPEEALIEGVNYRKGQLELEWETSSDEVVVKIQKNDTTYQLTRLEAVLWKEPCERLAPAWAAPPDIELDGEAPRFGSTFKLRQRDAHSYKCGRFKIYGKKKR